MATLVVNGNPDCPHEHLGDVPSPHPDCWPVTTCARCGALVVHDVPDDRIEDVAEQVRRQLEA